MSVIEQRARELLAAEFERIGFQHPIEQLRSDRELLPILAAVVRVISTALTPPEGYAEAVRDAARYRYIRGVAAGEPTAFGRIEDAAFAAHYGDPVQFDFNIDEQMAGCPEVSP